MSVFANGMGVSGKATGNKSIAAMPDVCLSPPPPPAGPVPIPYPLMGMASDTADGCTSVIVMGKEAGKKNATKYSKTSGDEAATNSFGAGVVSHKLGGALKFAAYSFDVMFEGGGACRFMDLTTTNHMNQTNGGVTTSVDKPAAPVIEPVPDCAAMRAELDSDRAAVQTKVDDEEKGHQSQSLNGSVVSGTLASAVTSPGGTAYGCSNQLLADKLKTVGQRPYPTDKQAGYKPYAPVASSACGDKSVEHPTGRHSRHAEMNILNKTNWATNPPKVITFCISYPATGGGEPDMPCPVCAKTLQKVCACVDQIYICDANNNPEPQCKK